MKKDRAGSSEGKAIREVNGRRILVEQGEGAASLDELSVSDGESGVTKLTLAESHLMSSETERN